MFDLDPGRDLAKPTRVTRIVTPSRSSSGAIVAALVAVLVVVATRRRAKHVRPPRASQPNL